MITIIILFQWIFLAFVAAVLFRSFRLSLFHPATIYTIFHSIVFVIRPTLVTVFDFRNVYNYMQFYPGIDDIILSLSLADFGLIVFITATVFASRGVPGTGAFPAATAPSPPPIDAETYRAAKITCLVFGPFVVASLLYSLTHPILVGGFNGQIAANQLTRDAATGAALYTNSTAYLTSIQYSGATLAIMWAYVNRFKLVHVMPFLAYVAARAFMGGGRFSFTLLSIAFALTYLVYRRKIHPTIPLLVGGLALGLLFGQIGTDRMILKKTFVGLSAVEESIRGVETREREWSDNSTLDGPDFANFEYLTYVAHHVPKSSGTYTYFTQYLTLLVKPIPRILWHDKPTTDVVMLIDFSSFGNFRGLSPSLVGDGWMSAGVVGVLFTVGAVGWVFGWAYTRFARLSPSHFMIVGYCVFLGLSFQWFRDGGYSIAEFLAFHLLPIFTWSWVYRRIARGQGRPQAALGGPPRRLNSAR